MGRGSEEKWIPSWLLYNQLGKRMVKNEDTHEQVRQEQTNARMNKWTVRGRGVVSVRGERKRKKISCLLVVEHPSSRDGHSTTHRKCWAICRSHLLGETKFHRVEPYGVAKFLQEEHDYNRFTMKDGASSGTCIIACVTQFGFGEPTENNPIANSIISLYTHYIGGLKEDTSQNRRNTMKKL